MLETDVNMGRNNIYRWFVEIGRLEVSEVGCIEHYKTGGCAAGLNMWIA